MRTINYKTAWVKRSIKWGVAEEMVNKLRQADVELSRGVTVAQACK